MAIGQVYFKSHVGYRRGSCLGPLLFILYLHDFESCLEFSKAILYADDTEVSFSSSNPCNVIQNFQVELKNVLELMRMYKLSIHPEKTVFMVINHPRRQKNSPELPPFYLNNTRIKQVHETKYLGLTGCRQFKLERAIQICQRESCGWPGISQEIKGHLATISVT